MFVWYVSFKWAESIKSICKYVHGKYVLKYLLIFNIQHSAFSILPIELLFYRAQEKKKDKT